VPTLRVGGASLARIEVWRQAYPRKELLTATTVPLRAFLLEGPGPRLGPNETAVHVQHHTAP